MAPNNQTLGNNELGAWRIFSLFMLLIQKGPLPSAEIYAAIYSDLSTDSALRTFSRDRTVLKQLGFAITEVKTGKEKSFYLSDSNFFNSSYDLSPEDANQLLVVRANLSAGRNDTNDEVKALITFSGNIDAEIIRDRANKVRDYVKKFRDYNNKGGWAAQGNLNLQLSDLGTVNMQGRYVSEGFGGLEEGVNQRAKDNYK